MLAKNWKRIGLIILIVACFANITSKFVQRVSFNDNVKSTVTNVVEKVDETVKEVVSGDKKEETTSDSTKPQTTPNSSQVQTPTNQTTTNTTVPENTFVITEVTNVY